jgi:phosphoribosylanthranilate isomerase
LQLHGKETPDRVRAVRSRFGLPVMKAIGVRDAEDVATAVAYAAIADRLLLDAKPPKNARLPGGNGVQFDWRLLQGFAPAVPYLLSGGLDAGTVGEAVGRTGAAGVDVSSGVERGPGDKDIGLIRAFVSAARTIDRVTTDPRVPA